MSAPPAPASGDPERCLRLLRDDAECSGVVHREVRKHLAVDREARLLDAANEPAVREAVQARRGVDARDPERPELAFLRPPVAIGVLAGLDHRLLRRAVDLAPGVVVALRLRQNFLVTAPRRHATLDSCHEILLERRPLSNRPLSNDDAAPWKRPERRRVRSRCPVVRLFVIRQHLHEATHIALVDEAAAAGAQVALALAVLVSEIVAAAGRI